MIDLPQGLFPILDENYAKKTSTVEVIESFLDAELSPILVRSKGLSKLDYEEYIYALSLLKHEMDFEYIIHHHIDQMPLSGAAGLHLTANSISVAEAREELGYHRLIGRSTHSIDQALQAEAEGADYLFFGSVFKPAVETKDYPVLGIQELKKVCKKINIPVYAIGGIDAGNLMQIKDAGAAGFAALGSVYENTNLDHNITVLNMLWKEWD